MSKPRNFALVSFLLFASHTAGAERNASIATWAASPQSAGPGSRQALLNIDYQTVRERVRVSIGGVRICLRLSNEYGSSPRLVGSATVAAANDWNSVRPGRDHSARNTPPRCVMGGSCARS